LTFKTLCELAGFQSLQETETQDVSDTEGTPTTKVTERIATSSGLTVNINIQLQLPATENEEIYDKLFQALKKHLLS